MRAEHVFNINTDHLPEYHIDEKNNSKIHGSNSTLDNAPTPPRSKRIKERENDEMNINPCSIEQVNLGSV